MERFVLMAASAVLAATSAVQAQKVVDSPYIESASSSSIDIERVTLTDSVTVLDMHGYYRPHMWIRIVPETVLMAGGKAYAARDAKGAELGKELWMPESGDSVFTLYFEPLPLDTRTFDFIEGNEPGAFRIWGVDLSGEKSHSPAAIKPVASDVAYPEFMWETGESRLTLHFPEKNRNGRSVSLILTSPVFGQEEIRPDSTAGDVISFRFPQYGTCRASLVLDSREVLVSGFLIAPGDDVQVDVNTHKSGDMLMARRRGMASDEALASFSGRYADVNNLSAYDYGISSLNLSPFMNPNGDAGVYGEMIDLYNNARRGVESMDIPQVIKAMSIIDMSMGLAYSMGVRTAIRVNERLEEKPVPADSAQFVIDTCGPSADDIKRMAEMFDLSDDRFLLSDFPGYGMALLFGWRGHFADPERIKDIKTVCSVIDLAKSGTMTQENFAALDSLSNPLFAAALRKMNDDKVAQIASYKEKVKIETVPDVADGELFDAIVAPHKGKVVIVDFWNTWCGPCRASITSNEPLKDDVFADDDIVWIYLADTSSSLPAYLTFINGVRGLHYRMSEEQMQSFYKQFNLDGIPSYVLVRRDGTYSLRNDFRDHALMKKSILEALAE